MHIWNNKIVLALVGFAMAFFVGCAGSSNGANGDAKEKATVTASERAQKVQERESDKQAMLEYMFTEFINAINQKTPPDELLDMLTDSSEYWLDTLENHAKVYTEEELDTCQFYEVYSILLYRLYEREHLWEVSDDRMLWLYLSQAGIFHKFKDLKLGPLKIKNDRGSIGLAKSPDVPIMLFEWDDSQWKLNLVETIPLITKGVEATASKKSWSNKTLAIYWLEQQYRMQYSRLDESLYEPIGF